MKKNLLLYSLLGLFISFTTVFKAQIKEPTSSSQKADDGILIAYPNPPTDVLVFKTKDPSLKIKSVVFYSILGSQVANYNLNTNRSEINIERLKPGKYLIRYILSDNTQKVTQIVKQ